MPEFKIHHIKFADNVKGVEVVFGELNKVGDRRVSVAFMYDSEEDLKSKIELTAQEILSIVKKPVSVKAYWGGKNVAHYGRAE